MIEVIRLRYSTTLTSNYHYSFSYRFNIFGYDDSWNVIEACVSAAREVQSNMDGIEGKTESAMKLLSDLKLSGSVQ